MGANGFVAQKNYYAEPDQERKDFDAVGVIEEFGDLKPEEHPICVRMRVNSEKWIRQSTQPWWS
jgi:hypothetical protein